jgi:uncharacterized damage-inducible protein DinB
MAGWMRPAVILCALGLLIMTNVMEFRAKRRADQPLIDAVEQGSAEARLLAKQYRQTQTIEQLLHVISTMLFAILVALLWR